MGTIVSDMAPRPLWDTVVCCDFDGTITVRETLGRMLLHYVPELAQPLLRAVSLRQLSLRTALPRLIAALPSRLEQEIIAFMAAEPLRPGFEELLTFLEARRIPLIVVSSGLRFYIEARLAPWLPRIHAIHALEVDTTGPYMRLRLTHAHPEEALPKRRVLAHYPARRYIVIGDSISDFEVAQAADIVCARDRLLKEMQGSAQRLIPFEDFFDIRTALAQYLPASP